MSYFDLAPSHGRREAVAATTLSIALHLAFFALLLLSGGHGAPGRKPVGSAGEALVVEFVSIAPHPAAQAGPALPMRASVGTSIPTPTAAISRLGELTADKKAAGQQAPSSAQQEANTPKAATRTDTSVSVGTANGSKSGTVGPNDGYLTAIKTAILRRWSALHPGEPAPGCSLAIEQIAGGELKAAQASDCTEVQRRSLEAAALMAQPLPYVGYEAAFKKQLKIAFN